MTKKDLKREHVLLDGSNPRQSDAKKVQPESDDQTEHLSVNANWSNVKIFVDNCRGHSYPGKAKEVALKHLKPSNEFSCQGMNCFFLLL